MTLTNNWARIAIAVAASLLVASNASAVNLLANPSFELQPFTGAETFLPDAGDDWTAFDGIIRIQGQPPIGPTGALDGTVVLKGFGFGGAFQEVDISGAGPGQLINATAFAMNDSLDPMAGGQVAAVNIEWYVSPGVPVFFGPDAAVSFGSTIDATAPLNVWQQIGVIGAAVPTGDNGTATIARIVLITGAFNPGGAGGAPRFDSASLEIVPIPAAVWLFGSALGLLGFVRRRCMQ